MSTRRHKRSQARRDRIVIELVASCLDEFGEHAFEARYFVVVSSVQCELGPDRELKETSLEAFRKLHEKIEALIKEKNCPALINLVANTNRPDIFVTDSVLLLLPA